MSADLGVPPPGSDDAAVTPCATHLDLYLHPLLEEPPVRSSADRQTWSEYESLVEKARSSCAERQPVDHDDVLRARSQHPDDSLEALAARLDCSLSTKSSKAVAPAEYLRLSQPAHVLLASGWSRW